MKMLTLVQKSCVIEKHQEEPDFEAFLVVRINKAIIASTSDEVEDYTIEIRAKSRQDFDLSNLIQHPIRSNKG
jgi:hypothetical protein